MANEPSKTDIQTIFKRLRSIPINKQCFDCGAKNPTWASVTYGVFLCIDCSATHRSLGVHLTFIRSTQLDTSWTWLQLRAMQLGGNGNATAFFRQHGCDSSDSQQKYNSRAASMYRERLHSQALKAMKIHGTKVHLDSAAPKTPEQKEVDFFADTLIEETTNGADNGLSQSSTLSQPMPIANGSNLAAKKEVEEEDLSGAPSVDAALSMSPTEAVKIAEPRKSTIGARKQAPKKGLGSKKGLGAQKVRTNFKDIETQAEQKDKQKEMYEANRAAESVKRQEDSDRALTQMKLAYQDMSVDEKKRTEKMKNLDPKKKEQVDRLGMGFGGNSSRSGVSHSVLSDMTVIEQENPGNNGNGGGSSGRNTYEDRYSSRNRDRDDDFEIIGGFHSGPPKYDDSPFGTSSSKRKDDFSNMWGNSGSSSSGSKNSNWDMDRFDNKSSNIVEDIPSRKPDEDKGRSRKNYETPADTGEAQKKFGGAKAISSDAFFGKYDSDVETKHQLSKFEGQTSISSADFYGNGPSSSGRRQQDDYYNTGPDLQDIRDGVKQGVTKVAGRISNIANGIVNSLQDNYG